MIFCFPIHLFWAGVIEKSFKHNILFKTLSHSTHFFRLPNFPSPSLSLPQTLHFPESHCFFGFLYFYMDFTLVLRKAMSNSDTWQSFIASCSNNTKSLHPLLPEMDHMLILGQTLPCCSRNLSIMRCCPRRWEGLRQ